MSSDHHYTSSSSHARTLIPVSVNPNDDQRFIRFRSRDGPSNDIHDRMSARMREFEEECRRWREKFFNESRLDTGAFPSSSLLPSRPQMRVDFPDFPEFGPVEWPSFRSTSAALTSNNQRAFIEEDNDGRKRYKIQFDIGEFRPEELNVRVEGRMLIVKGDRQVKVGNATESKQFNREMTIPEFVDVNALQSYLSDDGSLTMEAPVLMDRFYSNNNAPALTSGSSYRQASPGRVLDTTFDAGRRASPSNFGLMTTSSHPSGGYSTTSSTSSFRQETNRSSDGAGLAGTSSFHRNSPLRDNYSSTSSTSTIVGGGANSSHFNNSAPATYTTRTTVGTNNRYDGTKDATYTFDLHEFAPEEISIQVNDTMLKVSALRQERAANGSTHREFKREIGLPDGAEPKRLTNTLSPDGILTISIPVRDYRPPLTPTSQSQQFNLPSTRPQQDSYGGADQQLKLTFDLSGYKPDDVTVKVNNNVLKVQAVHHETNYGNQINREYMREYVLPDWVDVDKLRAKMSEDSTLTVEVPIPHDRVPAFNRQINITQ